MRSLCFFFFFFNDTATTEIYTLSLHDALPISASSHCAPIPTGRCTRGAGDLTMLNRITVVGAGNVGDRKSTRLNSSHLVISYAVFCLKKKKKREVTRPPDESEHRTISLEGAVN